METKTQNSSPTYKTIALGHSDIAAMLELQNKIKSHDIIAKDAASLTAHFNAGHSAIGIIRDGVLIAQATIKPDPVKTNTATIGFLMTDPAHRGQGLSNSLIGAALQKMGYEGFDTAQARVKVDNQQTAWKHFERQGFAITETGESPDQKGRQVFTLQKALKPVFFGALHKREKPEPKTCHVTLATPAP